MKRAAFDPIEFMILFLSCTFCIGICLTAVVHIVALYRMGGL